MDTRGNNSRYESRTVRPTVRLASARPRSSQQPPPREPQQAPHFRQAPSQPERRHHSPAESSRRAHDPARHHADDLGRAQRTYTPASGRKLNSDLGRSTTSARSNANRPQRSASRPSRSGQRSPRSAQFQTRGNQSPSRRNGGVRPSRSQGSVIGQPLRRGAYSSNHMYFASGRPGLRRTGFRTHRGMPASAGPLHIRRGLLATLIVIFGIVGALFGAVSAGIEPVTEATQLDMPLMSPADLPISTPKKSWKQGSMPYLYQTDPMWAQRPYGGGTVRDNACGPTAFTMVYISLTGNVDYTPATMATWADAHGYAPSGATEWSFMTEGAAAFGISSKMFDSDKDQISAALSQGKPVVSLMNIGDFTNVGHFIVLSDIDGSGNVTVHDPASAWRSSHAWSIDTIVDQSTYSWAFSL